MLDKTINIGETPVEAHEQRREIAEASMIQRLSFAETASTERKAIEAAIDEMQKLLAINTTLTATAAGAATQALGAANEALRLSQADAVKRDASFKMTEEIRDILKMSKLFIALVKGVAYVLTPVVAIIAAVKFFKGM